MNKTPEQWRVLFERMGALWVHDGNPKRPHALLSGGLHSNGFFNGSVVIRKPDILSKVCVDLLTHIMPSRYPEEVLEPDAVAGSAEGAITMAYETSIQLDADALFTEKGPRKGMVLKRFSITRGAEVLVVEDVITSGRTTLSTIRALEKAGAHVLPFVLCIVNRSSFKRLRERSIVSLLHIPMPMWNPRECELCKRGSHAVRPKSHWEKLTAKY